MGQTYTGLSGKTKDDFGHGQARFVTYMNVFSNPISNPEMTEPIEIDPKQNEVEVGDVFFTTSSETPEEVGMSSILLEKRGKTYLNSFCFGFRPSEKIDSYYLAYMLRSESARAKITLLAQGISRYNISKNKVMEIAVSLPSLDEQKMIGQYFSQLDNLITLHQRKCALLFSPFQAFISMMFTTSTFSWEQRKLASLCEKFTDGDWIESKDQSDFGVRLVQTGNVGVAEYLDKTNNKKWISEDTFDRLHCEEVLPGDILISRLPEPAGRACIVPLLGTKMITAVDCTIVRTAPDMSNKFLVQYLSSQAYFDDVNTCLAGGTRQRISRGNLANFNVPIPVKKSEQDAIGMFFGYLDNLITLHQRQTIVYAVIRSIRKVILAERQYFAPPMVRKSP